MKIRNGFVSNSSSSSFVILLPENFDINSIDIENFMSTKSYYDSTPESVKKTLLKLIKSKGLWEEECMFGDYGVVRDILKKYVIAGMDTSSDNGQMVLADSQKIKKIMNNES